jgi:hypothetical protein
MAVDINALELPNLHDSHLSSMSGVPTGSVTDELLAFDYCIKLVPLSRWVALAMEPDATPMMRAYAASAIAKLKIQSSNIEEIYPMLTASFQWKGIYSRSNGAITKTLTISSIQKVFQHNQAVLWEQRHCPTASYHPFSLDARILRCLRNSPLASCSISAVRRSSRSSTTSLSTSCFVPASLTSRGLSPTTWSTSFRREPMRLARDFYSKQSLESIQIECLTRRFNSSWQIWRPTRSRIDTIWPTPSLSSPRSLIRSF